MLSGKTAIVAGATGEVGRGAAFALNQAGASVTLLGRSETKLSTLQKTLPRPDAVDIIAADYSTVEGAKELATKLLKGGKTFDIAVVSSGPWWQESFAGSELEVLERAVNANFSAQLYLFNVLTKHMTPNKTGGQYFMVNGAAAKGLPHTGVTGTMANAAEGASKVMFHECQSNPSVMPAFTQVMLESSVGHAQLRGDTTHDPNDYGRIFVAMALGMHETDQFGSVSANDALYKALVSKLN